MNVLKIGTLFVFAFLLMGFRAQASEVEPRSYINTPVGINFLLAGYGYLDGDYSTADSSPIKDAKLEVNTEFLAYVRSLNIFGDSGKFDIILPYSELSGSALVLGQPRERKISGLNDIRMRLAVNFYGSPALTPQEFVNYKQDFIVGASVQVSMPCGQYDADKLVNLGNNRWYILPDMGISKTWNQFIFELSSGIFFFTENDNYFGGKTLKQDPISSSQMHITYNFANGAWVALSGTYDYGGQRTVNNVSNDDLQGNLRAGITFSLPINKYNSLKLYASDAIITTAGASFRAVGAAWQYRWGEGL
jgi:hypothetical protein